MGKLRIYKYFTVKRRNWQVQPVDLAGSLLHITQIRLAVLLMDRLYFGWYNIKDCINLSM